jgi:hypothetical protein
VAFLSAMHRSRLCRLFACTSLLAALPALAIAQDQEIDAQQRIEAAYLYKFGGYVTWPDQAFASPNSPIVIGVAGSDPLAENLGALVEGRSIGNRPVLVKRVRPGDTVSGLHILFVAAGTPGSQALLDAARGRWTLAVTEGPDGLGRGADMTFVVVDDRVRFDVDLDMVQQSSLKLSSLLLSVAHSVSGASRQ